MTKERGEYAFWYSLKLITLDIPDNVQNIGNWAFDTCKNLTQVTINSSELGYFAFNNCPNIETVNISRNIIFQLTKEKHIDIMFK